jgi:hypothetical protein
MPARDLDVQAHCQSELRWRPEAGAEPKLSALMEMAVAQGERERLVSNFLPNAGGIETCHQKGETGLVQFRESAVHEWTVWVG